MIDALPFGICNETFVIQDQCKLIFNSEIVQIKSVVPKAITKELRSRVITLPTAHLSISGVFFLLRCGREFEHILAYCNYSESF